MVSYQRLSTNYNSNRINDGTELEDLSQFDIDLEAQTDTSLLPVNNSSTNKLTNGDEDDEDNVRNIQQEEFDDFSDFDEELGVPSSSSEREHTSNNQNSSSSFANTREMVMSGSNSILRTMSRYFNYLDRYSSTASSTNNLGSGSQNDGVFSNLSAKPDLNPAHTSDLPPTYIEASADTSPPYWESTIVNANGYGDEIFIDGLPVGNIVNFIWNALVSISFQYVGFVLTFVLHTSHAAKEGSKVGLGGTFFLLGWAALPPWSYTSTVERNTQLSGLKVIPDKEIQDIHEGVNIGMDIKGAMDEFVSSLPGLSQAAENQTYLDSSGEFSWKVWFGAMSLILFGVWIIISAFKGYLRARQMERVILMPPQEVNIHPEPESVRSSTATTTEEEN